MQVKEGKIEKPEKKNPDESMQEEEVKSQNREKMIVLR